MANDKTISMCGVCLRDINVGELHECPLGCYNIHQHNYKVFKTTEYEDEVIFAYMSCDCGSVIQVKPKNV